MKRILRLGVLSLLLWGCNEAELVNREGWLEADEKIVEETPEPEFVCTKGSTDPRCTVGGVGHIVSKFTQVPGSTLVDIVWVVDNSRSMLPIQQELASNFQSFISDFITLGINFKMGITTTDTDPGTTQSVDGTDKLPGACGAFVSHNGNPTVLDSTMNPINLKTYFEDNISVGTYGSFEEKGLEAAHMALQNNPGFLRDDAYLIVIFVTDENDRSPESVEYYVDAYRSFKPDPSKMAIFSIIDTEYYSPDQDSDYLGHHPGGKYYKEATDFTEGFFSDINENFGDTLVEIGTKIMGLINTIPLAKQPVADTIKVFFDNQLVPNDEYNGWIYDPVRNELILNGDGIPPANTEVKISYKVVFKPKNDKDKDKDKNKPNSEKRLKDK